MRDDLRQRLRDLGVVKGVRELATQPAHRRLAIEDLVPGHFHTTSRGQCFVSETTYSPDYCHGKLPLSAFLDLRTEVLAQVAQDGRLAEAALQRFSFLDTETTGLSSGTGTMAFVVGVGFLAGDGFHVRQYFLRDPGDEPAMVEALAELVSGFAALVSFNGRAFDVPILENRFILARIPPPTAGVPHLDLLHPARRLWHYHLPSCALGALERAVLGVPREQDDVPSGIIPYLYRDYLRTGDAREMKRVLYHNRMDVLSLVTLATRLCRAFADPWRAADEEELSGAELFGLGQWYTTEGRLAEAERAYRGALCAGLAPDLRTAVLRALAHLYKQARRWPEACACWQQMALEAAGDVLAHVELAKYFEWQVSDISLAAGWTRAALGQVERWPAGMRRDTALAELRHRLARLQRKGNWAANRRIGESANQQMPVSTPVGKSADKQEGQVLDGALILC